MTRTSLAAVMLAGTAIWFSACRSAPGLEVKREDLLEVDRAFSRASVAIGRPAAFLQYMSEEAVLYPLQGEPIRGREEFRRITAPASPESDRASLEWNPFFADISSSGDLGYTLGSYTATQSREDGRKDVSRGYYVTIWKRQEDGSWKFVFDGGNQAPAARPDKKD